MSFEPYELVMTPQGAKIRIHARGTAVLTNPRINRGTAFTQEERDALGLTGLLPDGVTTIDIQARRTYRQYSKQSDNLAKWVYLTNLRDRNEVLFHRLLSEHLEEMLPVVYTPTVGLAIQRFSHEFRRGHGVYLSIERPQDIEDALRNTGLGPNDVDLLVATDSEGILGIGDQGVGGIEIAVGKVAVYTAAAGVHPSRALAVVLDVGTDNLDLLTDNFYLGSRQARVRGERYDEFIDAYVSAVSKVFPHAMLHWEDFGTANARRILDKYDNQVCTFNDDMEGTAAVVLAAVYAALRASGTRMRDQRVIIYGAGTAGLGIADIMRDAMVSDGLSPEEAIRRFYGFDKNGLLVDSSTELLDFQVPYARPAGEVAGWSGTGLADVVAQVQPTILIGTSTHAGAFTEKIVRQMAASCERPIILPLSNPTSKCEALPEDVLRWTDGRALVATGSPFAPVTIDDVTYTIAQSNNALVFPGIGLGIAVSQASHISDAMIRAAAMAVARISDASRPGAPLLPGVNALRAVSAAVAIEVAQAAVRDGVARVSVDNAIQQVHDAMWQPDYPAILLD